MLRNDTDMQAISTERGFTGRYHVPFVSTTIHVTCDGWNSCNKDTLHYKQVLCEFYHLITRQNESFDMLMEDFTETK